MFLKRCHFSQKTVFKLGIILFYIITFCNSLHTYSQEENAANILSKYISYKSISGNERPAGEYIKSVCEKFGLYTTVFSNTDSSYNFCASFRPLDEHYPSILLINHIDVVPVDDKAAWIHEPFSGTIANDTVYGRGAVDIKGLAIMQLFALKKLKERLVNTFVRYNVVVLFLSGEETGGKNGASKMIEKDILAKLNPVVVFGEGGGGVKGAIPGKEDELCFFISIAEKKNMWLKLEASIKANGHGSVSSIKSANKILLKAINKIESRKEPIKIDETAEYTFEAVGKIMGGYKGFLVRNMNLWLFKPLRRVVINQSETFQMLVTNSYQLTQIQNPDGGAVNQVSQKAVAYYDCRLLPQKKERPLLMKLFFGILDPRIKLTVLDESPEAEATKLDMHYDKMKEALLNSFPNAHIIPVLLPATTDNSYFRSVGIPAYGIIPIHLSREMVESVHAANEKMPISALDKGIQVYSDLFKLYLKQ